MFKKKTIIILCSIGIVADLSLFIFQPNNRLDAGIGLAVLTAVMIIAIRSDKFS